MKRCEKHGVYKIYARTSVSDQDGLTCWECWEERQIERKLEEARRICKKIITINVQDADVETAIKYYSKLQSKLIEIDPSFKVDLISLDKNFEKFCEILGVRG